MKVFLFISVLPAGERIIVPWDKTFGDGVVYNCFSEVVLELKPILVKDIFKIVVGYEPGTPKDFSTVFVSCPVTKPKGGLWIPVRYDSLPIFECSRHKGFLM
jgi:hypothetical protein